MTTYLGKSCSFCLPRVPFVNCRQFMYLVISLLVLRAGYGIWLYQFLIIAYLFTFQILNKAKLFYEDLYSFKDSQLTDINLHDMLLNTETEKLSARESNLIEGPLTYKEAGLTLKAMQNNRSPGSDGFSAEFFKNFWKNLGHFIVRSINHGFVKGELSITQRKE